MKATYRTIQDGQVYEAGEVIPYMGSIVCTKIRSGGRVMEYTFLSEDFIYLPKYDSLESGSKAYATDTDATYIYDASTKSWITREESFNKGVTDISITGKTVTITKGDGSTSTQTTQDTTYEVVNKSANGLAPKLPDETSTTKYLRQDGTWAVPPNQTYNKATQSSDGLMAKEDKTKLDGIEEDAQKNVAAYSNVDVDHGSKGTAGAINMQDTLSLLSGDNVKVEVVVDSGGGGDGNSIKFSAKDTTYNDATQSSHGLMTATDKTKLDGLPTGTELENTYADKSSYLKKTDATLTYVSKTSLSTELAFYAKKSDITNMYVYKGSVADASKLPTTGQQVGWVYNIESASVYGGAGMNVAWNGTAWDPLGGIFTITAITNEELDEICV